MNRNDTRLVEDNPQIKKRRSYIPFLKHTSQLDFNAGLLIPLDKPWEVLPGDTFKVKHGLKLRMSNPPKVPPFGQLVFDMFYFYTPLRILWNSFDDFITGNTGDDWTVISDSVVPTIESKKYAIQGSLADYLGVPLLPDDFVGDTRISALPFRGYYDIWNKYFRFQPLQQEVYVHKGTIDILGEDINTATIMAKYYTDIEGYMSDIRSGAVQSGCLMPVNKLDDYFTRSLPQPQAGPDVSILGFDSVVMGSSSKNIGFNYSGSTVDGDILVNNSTGLGANQTHTIDSVNADFETQASMVSAYGPLSGITGNSVRELRYAIALDQLLTNDARYGRRITENIYAHWGVRVPDYRVDFPEFLSSKRIYINVNEVIQSSASEVNSPQGNVGAWSETRDSGFDFVKSFVEHGLIYCLGCVRILNRIYSQGMDMLYRRFTRFDFYIPEMANISDTPVFTRQIYLESEDDSVWGYQEYGAELRFMPNHVANHMRPYASNTLAVWNYAESYSSKPTLSEAWIIEDPSIIDRTMYLSHSATVSQFILEMYFDIDAYRTMPLHTIPGGLTHSF